MEQNLDKECPKVPAHKERPTLSDGYSFKYVPNEYPQGTDRPGSLYDNC